MNRLDRRPRAWATVPAQGGPGERGTRTWRQFIARCIAVGLAITAGLTCAAPPAADVFYKENDISEAVLSPSGRRVALTARGKGLEFSGLLIIDLAPGGKMERVAQYLDGDVVNVHWVNETRLVYSVVDQSQGSGLQYGGPGLFAIDVDGNKFVSLVQRFSGGFGGLAWNHLLLSVPRPVPGEVNDEVLIAQFSNDEYGYEIPVWLNTRTGRTRAVDVSVPPDVVDWLADSQGELRVAFTRRENRQAAYWRGPGSNQWQLLYASTSAGVPFNPNSVDGAGNLYVTQTEAAGGVTVLKRYDFAKRAPADEGIFVTPGFDFWGGLITNGPGPALGVRVNVDAEATVWFNAKMKALQDEVDALLPGRVNHISCRRCAEPDMVALIRSYSDREPGQLLVHLSQPAQGEAPWRVIGRVREDVKPNEMAITDFHRIKARDGLDLPVWITRPRETHGPLPAVVLVHGGPWDRGRFWGWSAHAQFLATRGYVVIEPEMRGSVGYGIAHYTAGFKQFGQAMQDDVADALRWAQAEGIANDKACIAGASYGGYSALMGLINDPDLYRCGVAWLAPTDLDLYVKGSWRVADNISSAGRRYSLPELVGDAVKDAEMIARNSPVKQAARIKAPLLLAYGEEDKRVPLEHGQRLRRAMHEAGNDPVWVTYSGEAHGFVMVKHKVDFAQRMAAFLAQHLGPSPAPAAQP